MASVDRERQAFEIFTQLCDLSREQRSHALIEKCGDDPELRSIVEALFAADGEESNPADAADDFLTDKMREIESEPAATEPEKPTSGQGSQYRILRVIGEGGMGTVYEAEQVNPRRRVAIKAVRTGLKSPSFRRRFEYEAQILARLEHVGIARLYEADTRSGDPSVQAYLAMEFVDGLPIDEFVVTHNLDIPARLRLFQKLCEPIEYAHRLGVIHRDLKPANVLVNRDRQPKVLDFGVARTLGSDIGNATMATDHGQIVGTLQYMSPEQVEGSRNIDTRCDVYALGVILFKLLSGQLPIDIAGASLATATQKLLNSEPERLRNVDRSLRGDLDTIVAKALARSPAQRYASVADFASDIERFLLGRPILARSDSAIYVLRKSLWRHRRLAAIGVVIAGLLLAFGIISSMQASSNRRLAIAAEEARTRATQQAEDLRHSLYFSNIGFAQATLGTNDSSSARRQLDACPSDLRHWEWRYLNLQTDHSRIITKLPAESLQMDIALTANGRHAILMDYQNTFHLYDAATGKFVRSHLVEDGTPNLVTIGEGTSYVLGGNSRNIKCYDMESGSLLWSTDPKGPDLGKILSIASSSAPVLVFVFSRGDAQVRSSRTGEILHQFKLPMRSLIDMRITDDARTIYTIDGDRKVASWDAATGAAIASFDDPQYGAHSLSVSPDGTVLVIAGAGGPMKVWDIPSHSVIRRFDSVTYSIGRTYFSADGKEFSGACSDYAIRQWSVRENRVPRILRGSADWTQSMIYLPDSGDFISVDAAGYVRQWEPNRETWFRWLSSESELCRDITLGVDSSTLFCAADDGTIRRWRRANLLPLPPVAAHDAAVLSLAAGGDGNGLIASGAADGSVKLWDAAAGTLVSQFSGGGKPVHSVAVSADGAWVASGDDAGAVRIWPRNEPNSARIILRQTPVRAVQFDAQGKRLFVGSDDGMLSIYDVRAGTKIREIGRDGDPITTIRLSRDDKLIAVGTRGGGVAVFNAENLSLFRSLGTHQRDTLGLAFSPDGLRLFSAGEDRIIRIWDVYSGAQVLTLLDAGYDISGLDLSDDGTELVACTTAGRIVMHRCEIPPPRSTTQPATQPTTTPVTGR